MNKPNISRALTIGLLAGYTGKTEFKPVSRSVFTLKSSHFEEDDVIYHDEWTNGGGQEIVRVGSEQFTRVYAGGTVNDNPAIIPKLIYFIQQLRDKTRLFTDCESSDGLWQYHYKVIDIDSTLDITVGKETISLNNQIVFVHYFILSPII